MGAGNGEFRPPGVVESLGESFEFFPMGEQQNLVARRGGVDGPGSGAVGRQRRAESVQRFNDGAGHGKSVAPLSPAEGGSLP